MSFDLFELPASSYEAIFGTHDSPTPKNDIWIIAQKEDCSSFLVLSGTNYKGLDPFKGYDEFTFTFKQEWGLTINDEVIKKVKYDIRGIKYGTVPEQLDSLYHDGYEGWKAKIAAVKSSLPLS
jgi:hypothetical protein